MPEAAPPPWLVKVTSVNEKDEEMQGTAVFIAPNLLLTCCHVVWKPGEPGQYPFVYVEIAGRKMPTKAGVLHPEPKEDLALLEIEEPIGDEIWIPGWLGPPLQVNQDVRAMGFPNGEYVRSKHTIKQVHKLAHQINGEVHAGTSGGVLQCWDEEVTCVGLIRGGVIIASEVIPYERIVAYLGRFGHSLPTPVPPKPSTLARNFGVIVLL